MNTPKAVSVTEESQPDGWTPTAGYTGELDPAGPTRLVISLPADQLQKVHTALVSVMAVPLGLLYRRMVNRKTPRPSHMPPEDFVSLELTKPQVLDTLQANAPLVYHDARAEYWIRGKMGEQVVMDCDGLLYCYPDDPLFRDVLDSMGIPDTAIQTMAERDYVKHWFHSEADDGETALMSALSLQQVPHRKG